MRLLSGIIPFFLTCAASATTKDATRRRQDGNAEYRIGNITLDTPWTASVGTNPWPEHPRPRLQRAQWKNLNGVWRFRNATKGDESAPPFGQSLERAVLIPSCLESALSGITELQHTYSWFQTSFNIPSDWQQGNHVVLNFGAVDYEATVFVNGQKVGNHIGGYFEFSFDITNHLSSNGTNELLVHVYDPTDMDRIQIPIGKQTLGRGNNPIWYTPCTGIWQTVWLESTPPEYISKLDLTSEMDGTVNMTVHSNTNSPNTPFQIDILEPNSDKVKFTASGTSGEPFVFKVDAPQLWTPDTPTLYKITVRFGNEGKDKVSSYTGFRTISRGVINGIQRPLLNGKFIFSFGPLDQGYWPDGIYTAPSVEAMEFDLKQLKQVGINMLRKHIKVEPALYYRACDEMGLLVMQDMPSLRPDVPSETGGGTVRLVGEAEQREFNRQVGMMVEQLKNYPSIFAWVIYNEEWGQATTEPWPEFELTDMVRSLDPTRLVNAVSGWTDHTAGDFDDNHHYSSPQCGTPFWSIQGSGYNSAYDPSRIAFQGEFGGVGQLVAPDSAWFPSLTRQSSYELTNSSRDWNDRCHDLLQQLRDQVERYACSGAVWTQMTDVEGEVNGLVTYDRRVVRMERDEWRADVRGLYEAAARRGEVLRERLEC